MEAEGLASLVQDKDLARLKEAGGVQGVVDLVVGLSEDDSRARFGVNRLPIKGGKGLWRLLWEAYQDFTLKLLTIAALVSLAIGIYGDVRHGTHVEWIEGAAILMAVLLVVGVNAANDWQKERQFRQLNAQNADRQVTVIRGNFPHQVSVYDLLVGQVLSLEAGDVLPADGLLLEATGTVRVDESSLTGESDAIVKSVVEDPFFLSGSRLLDGSARVLVVAVGVHSLHGRMMQAMTEPNTGQTLTPLQMKLESLAERIARIGAASAIVLLVSLTIKYMIQAIPQHPDWEQVVERLLSILIQAITLVVVAVPEGLPMAVMLCLSYATRRMASEDGNLVRFLAACETAGSATCILSDKTGTLTENCMTVVAGRVFGGIEFDRNKDGKSEKLPGERIAEPAEEILKRAVALNSTAYQDNGMWIGSKTEVALLQWVSTEEYAILRTANSIKDRVPFSSERKFMATRTADGWWVKGASEIILAACTHFILPDGVTIKELGPNERVLCQSFIESMATDALRTIGMAFKKDGDEPLEHLTLIGLVGIEDPLRQGVAEAVETCQQAGIFVRMVTGDNAVTAESIARRCGILQRGGLVLEGPRFRGLSEAERLDAIPRLQVLARSSPLDKQLLVAGLHKLGEVVAVTGDGTNDGPALKAADVGFAMGQTGTAVAREAADIVMLRDDFASIVRAVAWGRGVTESVRRFLQFQLTVNVSAVLVSTITALASKSERSVLTAVQLLWVNLLMDSLGALALATDPPDPHLLERHPEPVSASLITPPMWKQFLGQAGLLTAILLMLYFYPFPVFLDSMTKQTFIFNAFVWWQLWNEINCRVIDTLNPLRRIHLNWIFILIWISSALIQTLIIALGGRVFSTVPLSPALYAASMLLGFLALPWGLLIRLIPWGKPVVEHDRIFLSRERLQWQAAAGDVQRRLQVFAALRRAAL